MFLPAVLNRQISLGLPRLQQDLVDRKAMNASPNLDASRWYMPAVGLEESQNWGTDSTPISKYRVVGAVRFSMQRLADVQAAAIAASYDMLVELGNTFVEYKGYLDSPYRIGHGTAFEASGISSDDVGTIFPGHWLFAKRSAITTAINSTIKTIQVASGAQFSNGQYLAMVEAPGGVIDWSTFENLNSCTISANTITASARGYKSTAKSFTTNAIVMAHALGQASDNKNWLYNMSTACPVDGNGLTYWQFAADWLMRNYKVDADKIAITFGGPLNVYTDVDASVPWSLSANVDVDNDGVSENGIIADVNTWQAGIDAYWQRLRTNLADDTLSFRGGTRDSAWSSELSGAQLEGFPADQFGATNSPTYTHIGSAVANFLIWKREAPKLPNIITNLFRIGTPVYDLSTPGGASMNPFYLSLAMCACFDVVMATQNWSTPVGNQDPWYDEYAVFVNQSGVTGYSRGDAIPKTDVANARRCTGWLGRRLRPVYRYGAGSPTVHYQADFSSGISGWVGANVTLSHDTTTPLAGGGTGCLKASKQIAYASGYPSSTAIKSPIMGATNGVVYTVSMLIKASAVRIVRVSVWGSVYNDIRVTTRWQRINVSLPPVDFATNSNALLFIQVGNDSTEVWIDDLIVYEGNYDVFVSEHENGIVICNATTSSAAISLGATYQYIARSSTALDPDGINTGNTTTSVTVPALSGRILLRP